MPGSGQDDGVSTPPPPPGEPLTPIVLPAESMTPTVLPAGSPTRSPVLLWSVAIAATVGLLVNLTGMFQFPNNAPIEVIYALGISIDLMAVIVASVVGAVLARRGYPLREKTAITSVALVLAGVATLIWVVAGGIWSIVGLAQGNARYMNAAGGLFLGGFLWVLALVFASHGYRRGGSSRNNLFAIIALAVVGALVLFAIVSSVMYGLGLTN